MTNTKATVGMVATYFIGSDSYAGTIEKVSPSGSFVTFKFARRAEVRRFNRNAAGEYQGKGGIGSLVLGISEDHQDPSF